MSNREILAKIFNKAALSQWGVASFADTLPLIECRAVKRLPPSPRSVIVCLLGYYAGERPHNISRYAWARDYHTLANEILAPVLNGLKTAWPDNSFSLFCDSSPIREVYAAYLAGLGFIGKNGLLINPRYGSMHFIAEIVTDLKLEAAEPSTKNCGECRECLDACPGQALKKGGLCRERCRSFITQKKGTLSDWEKSQVLDGGLVWGCDKCIDACPCNKSAGKTDIAAFCKDIVSVIDESNLQSLVAERAFGYKGAAVCLRNLRIIDGYPDKRGVIE